MLDALRFTASAVAKRDIVPELTHYRLKDGRVSSFNGRIGLSAPIDLDLDILPSAVPLIHAIRACPEAEGIALNITPSGRLAVRSGPFKAFIQCLPDDGQHFAVEPQGESIDPGPHLMAGIRAIAPIMGIDASRPWCMGIRLNGPLMYATNNIVLVKYYHGSQIPLDVVIPSDAVSELLRINESPERVQVTDNSISFHFSGERWLHSQLLNRESWPHTSVERALDRSLGEQVKLPDRFAESLSVLKPFLNERGSIYLDGTFLSTSQFEGEGASIEVVMPQITGLQAYHHHNLLLLCDVAHTIDWRSYPDPCVFQGPQMLGIIIGQKII